MKNCPFLNIHFKHAKMLTWKLKESLRKRKRLDRDLVHSSLPYREVLGGGYLQSSFFLFGCSFNILCNLIIKWCIEVACLRLRERKCAKCWTTLLDSSIKCSSLISHKLELQCFYFFYYRVTSFDFMWCMICWFLILGFVWHRFHCVLFSLTQHRKGPWGSFTYSVFQR